MPRTMNPLAPNHGFVSAVSASVASAGLRAKHGSLAAGAALMTSLGDLFPQAPVFLSNLRQIQGKVPALLLHQGQVYRPRGPLQRGDPLPELLHCQGSMPLWVQQLE
mmetsp:Transcript_60045/g.135414  ORF Transcript_60045/g.135414 Transcript_60045/m.135414 type:complete len:107 (-) Transcript_60045:1232-1552(-)